MYLKYAVEVKNYNSYCLSSSCLYTELVIMAFNRQFGMPE